MLCFFIENETYECRKRNRELWWDFEVIELIIDICLYKNDSMGKEKSMWIGELIWYRDDNILWWGFIIDEWESYLWLGFRI